MSASSRLRTAENDNCPPPKRARTVPELDLKGRMRRARMLGENLEGRRPVISDEEVNENNRALKVESIGSALKMQMLDFNIEGNGADHHTSYYEIEGLVVRRGQKFKLGITFDRNINKEKDVIYLQFVTGQRPQENKGTLVRVPVSFSETPSDGWTASAVAVADKSLGIEIISEPDSNIGRYMVFVETKLKGHDQDFTRSEPSDEFIMIFNPWCEGDTVFMAEEDKREEYVMNETGNIWVGSRWRNYGKPWNFGQFENPVLEVALNLLDKAELGDTARNSAVSVIRCMSAMVNSNDDDGVLMGNWSGKYSAGTSPSAWIGSVAILEEYSKTDKPVMFGQCWVFSGLVTTLLRSLGIPTRSVTNFDSAHDCDTSMTIDSYINEDDEPIREGYADSTWNFHVWNESWLRRLDLPDGYDGWQAHDATPQELSEGVMRCGPAPLKAIKMGHVYLSYDVGFIFSEVNGDKITWQVAEDGSMTVKSINKYAVGHNISTKAVGSEDRNDLTSDYKFYDGSKEEREVVKFVNRFSTERKKNIYKHDRPAEVTFELVAPDDKQIGEDITVGVLVTNTVSEDRNIRVNLTMASTHYTGITGKKVQHEVIKTAIKASEKSKPVTMTVSRDKYEAAMNAEADFKLTVACRVQETDNVFAQTDVFTLLKPQIKIKASEKICCYTETVVSLELKNTTNLQLHNGTFFVEGSFLAKGTKYPVRKIIQPGETVTVDVPVFPRRTGKRKLNCTFSSDDLTGMENVFTFDVLSKDEFHEGMETGGDN